MDKDFKTDIWRKFEKCLEYTQKKQIMTKTEKNWQFYVGNQWKGLKTGGEELPMFNFVKPIVRYKVNSIASNTMTARYNDIEGRSELNEVYEALNIYREQCWEKSKMNECAWEVLTGAAVQGDSYVYWQDGDTLQRPQILPNTSIFFENENIRDIQDQEFIIVLERWSLSQAKALAKENGVSNEDIQLIYADDDTDKQLFNKTEVSDKVTVLLYMEKKNGIVYTGRSTESVVIEPLEAKVMKSGEGEIKGKLTVYPIISYLWETVPNSARGIGEVEQLIPNQLELNKTLARRSMAIKMGAYPRMAYDANAIENPEDLDKVGAPIAMQGGNAQSINQMISYLNPAGISADATSFSSELLQTTKDLAGASDYALGNVNPEQASGTAIMAVRDQSQVPLNEQVSHYKQWVEDISLLWLDLWVVYNQNGIQFTYVDEESGQEIPINLDHSALEGLKPSVKIDVSPDNGWTKLAEQQALDTLLQMQMITFEEYVDLAPDGSGIPKNKLKTVVKKREALAIRQQQEMMQQQMMMQAQDQVDPNIVLQELINKGVPEDEALAMVQSLGEQGING